MRILVTGSRALDEQHVPWIRRAMIYYHRIDGPHTLVSGSALGADAIAEAIATANNWEIERYPADWKKYGKAAGPIRNGQMLDSGVDVVVAFPNPRGRSDGTWDAVHKAAARGIEVVIPRRNP